MFGDYFVILPYSIYIFVFACDLDGRSDLCQGNSTPRIMMKQIEFILDNVFSVCLISYDSVFKTLELWDLLTSIFKWFNLTPT